MTARTSASARSSHVPSQDRAASAQRFIVFFDRHIRGLRESHGRHSDTEQSILLALAARRECTASEVARVLQLDRGYLSRILQAFRREALVAETSGADRRARVLKLTARGRRLAAALQRAKRRRFAALFERLSAADAQALITAMREIELILARA
jgi:DNA-binding MarR family transcriptional regulator